MSPRRLGLATYLNPRSSSLTIPRKERIKASPNTVRLGADFLHLPRLGPGNPAGEHFAIKKKPVRYSFGVLVFYLTQP